MTAYGGPSFFFVTPWHLKQLSLFANLTAALVSMADASVAGGSANASEHAADKAQAVKIVAILFII
jgi:hypothetical protein